MSGLCTPVPGIETIANVYLDGTADDGPTRLQYSNADHRHAGGEASHTGVLAVAAAQPVLAAARQAALARWAAPVTAPMAVRTLALPVQSGSSGASDGELRMMAAPDTVDASPMKATRVAVAPVAAADGRQRQQPAMLGRGGCMLDMTLSFAAGQLFTLHWLDPDR